MCHYLLSKGQELSGGHSDDITNPEIRREQYLLMRLSRAIRQSLRLHVTMLCSSLVSVVSACFEIIEYDSKNGSSNCIWRDDELQG